MAEKKEKELKESVSNEVKTEEQGPKITVSGISGTKTLRVGRVNKKAKKPSDETAPVDLPVAPTPEKKEEKPKAESKAAPKTESKAATKKQTKPADEAKAVSKKTVEEPTSPKAAPAPVKEKPIVKEAPAAETKSNEQANTAPAAKPVANKTAEATATDTKPKLSSSVIQAPTAGTGNVTRETGSYVRPQGGGYGGYQGNRPQGGPGGYQGNRPQGGPGGYQGNRPQGGPGGYQGNRPQGGPGGYQGNRPQGGPGGYQGNRPQGGPGGYQGNRPQGGPGGYQGNRPQGGPGGYQGNRPQGGPGGYQGNRPRPGGNGGYQGGFAGKDKDDDDYGNNHNQPKRSTKPKSDLPIEATKEKANFAARDAFEKNRKDPSKDSKKDSGKTTSTTDRRGVNMRAATAAITGMGASEILRDDSVLDTFYTGPKGKKRSKRQTYIAPVAPVIKAPLTHIELPEFITVKELAEGIEKRGADVIKKLMLMGMLVTLNQEIDFDTAALVAAEFGITAEPLVVVTEEDILFDDSDDQGENAKPRPPVVVVMGHVDHGKTSLLDKVRSTSVVKGEAGGITQHIGAYTVRVKGRQITFLDTPGHEAFTTMRARGAQVTDIAILVVAADDGVMPQTIEAINHARAANTEIIVAVTKIDKPGANLDKVKQELSMQGIQPEEWGGQTIIVPVSAKTGEGIGELLEMVLLTADVMDLKADPKRQAKGTVIEAKLDKSRGPVATVLVQRGTLHSGDTVVSGSIIGHIRAMSDDKGALVKKAGPSIPVEILGLPEVPEAGEIFYAVTDDKVARQLVEKRRVKQRETQLRKSSRMTLENLSQVLAEGEMKDLNLIIKADVQGSVEAVIQSLGMLSNEEVRVKVIHGGVGAITESDVTLADVSNAIIIGFNVRPSAMITEKAKEVGVDIKLYRVIYDAIEDVKAALTGMLKPKFEEAILGHIEIRQTFKVASVGTIGGAYVLDGKVLRSSEVRIVRDGIVVHTGKLASLKRFKDDAKEVASGYECGISIENFNDIKEGDIVEAFEMQEVKRK
ncbi:MAG TPA: translation initiation factor IF-2 [Bacillota bacterium]|nr:translation initiation factor IF-2 [Bacillota bacterium]